MALATSFEKMGFTISMYRPTIVVGTSYTAEGTLLGQLSGEVSSWTHEIQADGGFWTAEFTLAAGERDVNDWLAGGLGRHIACYDNAHTVIWAGFVNRISIQMGGLTIDRGPLMDIGNRVENYYTPVLDNTTDPPITGDELPTPLIEYTPSQQRWGIVEKIITSGQVTPTEAAQIAALYMKENRDPWTAKDFAVGSGTGNVSITVSCLGYAQWLEGYVYNDAAAPTSTTAEDKIQSVLGADPNGMFSTDYSKINANGTLVSTYENKSRTAWTIIKEIVALGDASENRWTFGVYQDQQAVYAAIPTAYEYKISVADVGQRVFAYDRPEEIVPWRVLPGKWLFYSDFLIGRVYNTDLGVDPRSQFIESVVYTLPYDLQLRGGRVSKLTQKLARLGLGGI